MMLIEVISVFFLVLLQCADMYISLQRHMSPCFPKVDIGLIGFPVCVSFIGDDIVFLYEADAPP